MHGGNNIDLGKVENGWGVLNDNDKSEIGDDYTITLKVIINMIG